MQCVAVHLAVSAAQPVAAHGIVGERALLAAVGSIPRAFLRWKKKKKMSVENSQLNIVTTPKA